MNFLPPYPAQRRSNDGVLIGFASWLRQTCFSLVTPKTLAGPRRSPVIRVRCSFLFQLPFLRVFHPYPAFFQKNKGMTCPIGPQLDGAFLPSFFRTRIFPENFRCRRSSLSSIGHQPVKLSVFTFPFLFSLILTFPGSSPDRARLSAMTPFPPTFSLKSPRVLLSGRSPPSFS